MRRRELIALLGGAVVARPLAARAQQPAMPVVAFLRDGTADGSEHFVAALRNGLREAGFVENQNVVVEYAWTDGHTDRLPTVAADLVRRRVSVIVTSATNATIAAKAATSTIPIVFVVAADPVEFKLVDSLSRRAATPPASAI
jgi:putative ABC transport system substrate-binding protein